MPLGRLGRHGCEIHLLLAHRREHLDGLQRRRLGVSAHCGKGHGEDRRHVLAHHAVVRRDDFDQHLERRAPHARVFALRRRADGGHHVVALVQVRHRAGKQRERVPERLCRRVPDVHRRLLRRQPRHDGRERRGNLIRREHIHRHGLAHVAEGLHSRPLEHLVRRRHVGEQRVNKPGPLARRDLDRADFANQLRCNVSRLGVLRRKRREQPFFDLALHRRVECAPTERVLLGDKRVFRVELELEKNTSHLARNGIRTNHKLAAEAQHVVVKVLRLEPVELRLCRLKTGIVARVDGKQQIRERHGVPCK
eukprot:Amastigsp_a509146_101.p3 type:complete len:308 gc:universal Amastigsp_a509146_101:1821-2744(+)